MSAQINLATASMLFDTEVTLQLQNSERLKGTIEERHGTTGIGTNIPVSDLIEMQLQGFAPTDIPVTPVDPTNVLVTPFNYALKTVIGGGERTLFAYDKIVDHARLHAKAGGRMNDYIKIHALESYAGYANLFTVPITVGVNTGMNEGKLAAMLSYLEGNSVDVLDHATSLWLPAIAKAGLMDDPRVVSFFYNDRRPLVDNRLTSYMGVDIRTLGNFGINKIAHTSAGVAPNVIDTYLVPLVAHESMVQIWNRDIQTSITWVPNNDRYELLTVMTSGAQVVQPNGIALARINVPYVLNPVP